MGATPTHHAYLVGIGVPRPSTTLSPVPPMQNRVGYGPEMTTQTAPVMTQWSLKTTHPVYHEWSECL